MASWVTYRMEVSPIFFYFKCFQFYCTYSGSLSTYIRNTIQFFKIFFTVTRQGLRKSHETSSRITGESWFSELLKKCADHVDQHVQDGISHTCNYRVSTLLSVAFWFILVISPIFYGWQHDLPDLHFWALRIFSPVSSQD